MKTKTTSILAAFATLLVLASCAAGRKANCDAYSSLEQTTQKSGDQEEQAELESFVKETGIEVLNLDDKSTWALK